MMMITLVNSIITLIDSMITLVSGMMTLVRVRVVSDDTDHDSHAARIE